MKVFKRLVSLCLTLLMLLSCLSGLTLDARAEETDPVSYDVWVLGTQVTEENKEDVLGDGRVRYDSAAKTLYLDSLGTRSYDGEAAIDASGDLILELNGKTILNQSNYGLRVTGSLRVRGPGSLTTTGKDTGVYAYSLYLVDEDNKPSLYANGYYYGIRAGELHLRQGTVHGMSFGYANETNDPVPAAGIYAFMGVVEIGSSTDPRFCRSNVTLTANGAQGAPAVYAYQGIQLSDAMEVTAPAAWSFSADGRTILDGDNPAAGIAISPKAPRNLLLYYPEEGGRLISDQHGDKAYPGQQITITAVPDADMYLNDLMIETVTDDGEPGETPHVTVKNGTYTFTMPDADVAVTADFSDWPFYDVAISETAHGTVTTPLLRQPEGETVELTVTPEEGYEFTSVQVQTAGGQTVELTGAGSDWSFKMPAEDVTVSATFRQKSYAIQVTSAQHGSVSASYNSAVPGASVNLYISENAGWHLETITVKDSTGNEIELIEFPEARKFTMPASAVTVTATFAEGYPLIVGGVRVTSTNAADIFGDGKASFDYPSRTLTLNDLVGLAQTSGNDALIEADGIDLKITGTATLAQTGSEEADYAIFAPTSTITIQGSNTEIITNTQKGGIVASNVSFEGGAVDIFVGQQDAIGVRVTGETGLSFGSGIRTVKLASRYGYPAEFSRLSMNGVFLYQPYQGGRNGKHFCDASFNAENVHTVIVMPTSGSYTVQTRINNGNNGTVTVEPSGSIAPGTSVTLTYTPGTSADSWIDSLRLTYDSGSVPFEALGNGQFRFIMPAWNVYANLNEIANDGEYDVTLATFGDGTLTSDVSSAKIYDTVTISAVPNRYSKLSGFLVTGASDGTVVSVTVVDESTYTFRMPKGGAKVEAYFDKIKYPLVFETYGYYGPTDEPFYWLNDDETHEITENYIIMPQSGYIKVYVRTPEGYTCSYDNLYRISGGSAEIAGGVNGGSRYNMRTFKMREVTDDHITISILCEREVDTPVSYPVWIGNTQVTNRNMGDVFKNGQWRYDPDTQTLYADNPGSISFNSIVDHSNTLIKASGIDLTVVCNGTLRSEQTGVDVGYGIWVENGSLTVNGDITVYSRSNALLADNIHIASGNVTVVGTGNNYTNVNCRNGGTLSVSNGARLTSAPGQWQSWNGVWYDHNGTAVAAGSVVCGSELAITTPAGGYCNGVNVVNASGSVVNRVVIGNKPLSVKVDPASHAAISVSPQANNLTLGTEVSFTLTPDAGYTLGAVEVRTETGDRVPFTKEGETYRLTMPTENVTVDARCSPILYNIAVADTEHGTVTPSVTAAFVGQTVSLEYLADPGYMPGVVMVTDAEGNRVTVTDDAFVMPASNVTVDVIFDQGEVQYPLWLGDTQVTNRNAADIFEDGKASYDHATHTLTLNNPSNWTAGHTALNHEHLIYTELPNLIVTGSATLSTSNERGFYAPNGTLTLSGSLQITSFYETVWAKDIVIADGTIKLNITGQYSVIRSENSLRFEKEITSIELTGKSNSNVLSYASLYISDDLAVTNPEGAYHDGSRVYNADGSAYTGSALKLEHRSDFGVRIESAHGTVTAIPARANPGDTVTLTVVADVGYSFNHFTVTDAAGNEIPVGTDGSFTMPGGEAYVVAHYDAIDYQVAGYFGDHGTVEPTQSVCHAGDSVLLLVQPEIGYVLSELRAEDENGVTIPVTEEDDGWRFTMPASDVTLSAVFERGVYTITPVESEHGTPTADKQTAYYGDVVTLTAPDAVGYTVTGFAVIDSAGNQIPVTENQFTMPAADVTFSAIYTPNDYTVTVSETEHGTVTARPQTAHVGDTVTLTVIPDTGYRLKDLRVEEDSLVNNPVVTPSLTMLNVTHDDNSNDWTFTMPASDVTVTAEFEAVDYTVTVAETEHGSVTASKTTANYGEEITLTANSDPGYVLQSLTVTTQAGEEIPVTDGSFTMPNDDVTVTAVFSAVDYTVTVNPVTNGTVTADRTTANYGDTVTLTITPDTGYAVESITVLDEDGSEITLSENSFTMPAANVVVLVYFRFAPYAVTVAPAEHGSVTALPKAANVGDVITLTVTPDEGYELQSLSVIDADGSVLPVTENCFTMPQSDVTVTAVFAPIDYTVTVVAPVGGTVVADRTTAHLGDTVTLTATPYEGYSFNCWTVTCGEDQTIPVENDRFTMPAANVTVTASFNAINYDITIADTENGTVTADKSTATVGETVTLTFIPAECYVLQSVTVFDANNHPIEVSGNQFTMPASAVTVTATFGTSVPYVDAQGNPMTPVSDVAFLNASTTELTDGWWVVSGNITNNNRLTVSGSVNLILCDGATLNATKGIAVGGNNSLTIWAQSHSDCRGKLTARANSNNAAIGSNQLGVGIIVINGGEITATGGSYGAGIGGGLHSSAGSITINNGKVSATGGTNAAGIGGGSNPSWGGHYGSLDTIMITGGEVSAVGNGYGAGIGGGGTELHAAGAGNVTAITITGGQITSSSPNGYGIGPGVNSNNEKNNGLVGDVITFGWTEETDFIQSSRNVSADKLTFVQGKFFLIDGEEILATTSNIQNACKLIPILNPLFSVTVDGGIINGTVAADVQKAASGDTVTLTVTPDEGYELEGLSVTDSENHVVEPVVEENGTYTFVMPASNVTVTATFTRIYTVTVLDTLHGTVTSDKATARPGQTVVITVTPDTCYRLDALTVTDADNNPVTVSANYTFTMPESDVTISASFKEIVYTITVNAPVHATVTVPETAHSGDVVSITVTTDAGYPLSSITVTDETGAEVPVTDGSFIMPASNVTVTVTVTATDYTVSTPPAVNGSVTADKSTAHAGDLITLTPAPAEGYVLDRIYVYDSVYHSIPLNEDNTFTMPAANVLVLAYFKLAPYTVTIAPTEHGTVTADKTTANAGERVTLTVTPDADWQIASLTVTDAEGNEVDLANGHFTMPASSVTVTAVFEGAMHTVTVSDTVNGTVTADPTSAHTGDTVTLTVTPDEGYELVSMIATDSSGTQLDLTAGEDGTYTFLMPAGNVTVAPVFDVLLVEYDLWLGDTQVTNRNASDILGNGKASYDHISQTLNLNGFDGVSTVHHVGGSYHVIYTGSIDLTVTGSGTIKWTNGTVTRAICAPNTSVTLNGDFTVQSYYECIQSKGLTVAGGSVVLSTTGYSRAIVLNRGGNLRIENGTTLFEASSTNSGNDSIIILFSGSASMGDGLVFEDPAGGSFSNGGYVLNADGTTYLGNHMKIVPKSSYSITCEPSSNGAVTADKASTYAGDTVTLTVTPDEGYELDTLTVTDSENQTVEVTDNQFTMPAANVTVTATFKVSESVTYTYFVGLSLSLDGDIGVNFYVKLNDVKPENAKVVFTWGDNHSLTVLPGELKADSNGRYKLTARVTAPEINDTISAVLYNGETEIATKQYSVAQYDRFILSASNETLLSLVKGDQTKADNLRVLCKAMLIYGAKSQLQFGYRVDALADQGLEYTLEDVGTLGTTVFPENFEAATGLKPAASSLVLETKTTYRLFFTVTDQSKFDALTVKLGTDTLTYGTRDQYIYYDIADIPAPDVLDDFTLTFDNLTVTANAGGYMTTVFAGSDETLQDTMKALYWYSIAAQSYFGVN